MSEVRLNEGIVLVGADSQSVANLQTGGRRTITNAFVADDLSGEVDAALAEADFSIDADVRIAPAPPSALPPGRRELAPTEAREVPLLRVEVEGDQSAVLLIESADGVFHWQFPDDGGEFGPQRRGAAAQTLVFTLAPAARSDPVRGRRGIGDVIGWVGERLIAPIRVRVLRFFASATITAAVDRIEGNLVPGLVWLDGSDGQWQAGRLPPPPLPTAKPARVLLLVHGTFSSTIGSYAALESAMAEGGSFLARSRERYDLVLGFDHKTLAHTPDVNAQQILDALDFLPAGTHIDAVAFSRGGLVYRALAERLAKKRNSGLVFGRAVFVGCTNSGTYLAEPDNWGELIDLYTNIGLAGARALGLLGSPFAGRVGQEAIRLLGGFVQALPQLAIEEGKVPGLAAMEPDGSFVQGLNEGQQPLDGYFAIVSDFEPRPIRERGLTAGLAGFLADRVIDRLMQVPNDLVVHTGSMSRFGADEEIDGARLRHLRPEDAVYHTVYFQAAAVTKWLTEWLLSEVRPEAEAPAPGGRRRRGRNLGPGITIDTSQVNYETPGPARYSNKDGAAPGGAMPTGARRNLQTAEPPSPWTAHARDPVAEIVPCHFAAEMFPTPQVGVTPLIVTISRQKLQVADHRAADATEDAVGTDPFRNIEVTVMAMQNCRVWSHGPGVHENEDGSSVATSVPVPDGTEVLRFVVEGADLGAARVQIEIAQGPHSLASFVLEPVFIDPELQRLTASQVARPMVPSDSYPAVLKIFEQHVPGVGLVIKYDLVSKDPSIAAMEQVTLPSSFSIEAFSKELLEEFDKAWNLGPGEYQTALRNFSATSANKTDELLPEPIRRALWENWDTLQAIQVFAENAYLPWELLSVRDPASPPPPGSTAFLAERGLVRWVYNAPLPGTALPVRAGKARYVIPEYLHRDHKLKYAPAEKDLFERLFVGAQSAGETSEEVSNFLYHEAHDCDVLHFTCHGDTEHKAVLSADLFMKGFDDGNGVRFDRLSLDTVKAHSRFKADNGPAALVFVNACKTGGTGASIAGVSGFAESFLRPAGRAGAAAFIGALWSVDDAYAYTFAETFYKAMLEDGLTLIEAVNEARKASKQAKTDFTWLAYSVYGNPMTRFVQE